MSKDVIKSRISIDTNNCWLWTGSIKSNGYPRLGSSYAHRESYRLFIGEIPDELVLDHICEIKHCVNPTHLRPVTQQFNILRGNANSAKNARKIYCKRGHLLSGDNLLKSLVRRCRTCMRWRQQGDPRYFNNVELRKKNA